MKKKRFFIVQTTIIAVVFALILAQGFTHFVPMRPLGGFTDKAKPVKLTFSHYYKGAYQEYLNERAKETGGFREIFIRCYNQLLYSGFNIVSNEHIVEGLNKEYYLLWYLCESKGEILSGTFPTIDSAKNVARRNVEKTLVMVDSLKNHGADFLFVFAPTKPAVYPEFMPDGYRDSISPFSMEEYYIELFKENGINHIDFFSYFKSIKDSFPYPLYPRYGTHWAESTVPMVADSIMRKIESITSFDLPTVECADWNITDQYSRQDGELENSMNLLFPVKKPMLPCPITTLSDTIGKDKPDILIVGDSYFVQIQGSSFVDAFENWDYWSYNRDIYSSNPKYNWRKVENLEDVFDVICNADIVLSIFTAPNFYEYMFGFCDMTLEMMRNGGLSMEKQIELMINQIKGNPKWFDAVKKQAEERNITLEEALHNNAVYQIKTIRAKQ